MKSPEHIARLSLSIDGRRSEHLYEWGCRCDAERLSDILARMESAEEEGEYPRDALHDGTERRRPFRKLLLKCLHLKDQLLKLLLVYLLFGRKPSPGEHVVGVCIDYYAEVSPEELPNVAVSQLHELDAPTP